MAGATWHRAHRARIRRTGAAGDDPLPAADARQGPTLARRAVASRPFPDRRRRTVSHRCLAARGAIADDRRAPADAGLASRFRRAPLSDHGGQMGSLHLLRTAGAIDNARLATFGYAGGGAELMSQT